MNDGGRALAEDLRSKRDDHLADLLIAHGFAEDVRYDHLRQRWMIWNGVRWRPDATRQVYEKMRLGANAAYNQADRQTAEVLMALYDMAKKESVLKSLSARDGVAMAGTEWDLDPFTLGFDNGLLDLRTTEFSSHPPKDLYVSKTVGCDWDPDAPYDAFESFILSIFPEDIGIVKYLMTLLGYSLFGLQSEQKFWMWVGRGSNGKGILARTMVHTLGEYAHVPADSLYMKTKFGVARSDAARPDLLKLQAVRFTYMSEPPMGQFNEEMLKAHTGEDPILARDLYGKSASMAEFAPTHKIIFLTNDPPKTDDVGVSMRRRARMIRFMEDFSPESGRADMTIEDRVKAQKQGILALLVKYARLWWNDGSPELAEPEAVTRWSEEYIEENDPLGTFVSEFCQVRRGISASSGTLWAAYTDYCARAGEEAMSKLGFGMALGKRFERKHTERGAVYLGIKPLGMLEQGGGADGD